MFHDLLQILRESWQDHRLVVVLSVVALAILIFVIVDTHRHRRQRRRRPTHTPPDQPNHRHHS